MLLIALYHLYCRVLFLSLVSQHLSISPFFGILPTEPIISPSRREARCTWCLCERVGARTSSRGGSSHSMCVFCFVPVPEVVGGSHLTATVIELNPWVEYEFRVLASNAVGTGEPSKPSKKARTKETGECFCHVGLHVALSISILWCDALSPVTYVGGGTQTRISWRQCVTKS